MSHQDAFALREEIEQQLETARSWRSALTSIASSDVDVPADALARLEELCEQTSPATSFDVTGALLRA
jgi:hypothetical protein